MNLTVSMLAMAFGLILADLDLVDAVAPRPGGIDLQLFTQMTPPPGSQGGLLNAIMGSFLMTSVATLIGTPIGILAGVYMAEFGQKSWLASATRFINDILLSAPSIVIGLFIYEMYVARVHHFSGWAGSFALALIVIPVVVRNHGKQC